MHVLIAEDQPQLAAAMARRLRREGMTIDLAADWAMALALVSGTDYDVLIVDGDVPGVRLDLIRQRLQERRSAAAILVLADPPAPVAGRVPEEGVGADAHLPKPFAWDALAARVRALGGT